MSSAVVREAKIGVRSGLVNVVEMVGPPATIKGGGEVRRKYSEIDKVVGTSWCFDAG